ncbi:glutaminyl-peptide cyclotransferase [Maricaulis sp.]|uniref:glutaminyl-peptide cyclotransferase n=1 Tax=unclassified Maricaulis TaxID=2632371 RepID=UPI001B1F6BB5|nr:glutaminyl-peptide cyclotransferase [Maricaulis sp.]MBO6798126.1 glutaminyl-peptide cyclotransferase [Maricaulis sp.]
MLRIILAASLLAGLGSAAPAQNRPSILRPEVVAQYPHDTAAYTQGLFISDNQLFESTGQVGESNLRRVELETGAVLDQRDLPGRVFGEGSTRIGNEIFVLTWRAQQGFIYDANTLEQTDRFTYPGEGWGLTTDGQQLIMSDGTAQLRFMDPQTLELTRELDVTLNGRPVRRLNELEWVEGEIWANVWLTNHIVRINPEGGSVTGIIDVRDLVPQTLRNDRDAVPNGIAYNPETGQIFLTGKLWPVLYEVRLPDES